MMAFSPVEIEQLLSMFADGIVRIDKITNGDGTVDVVLSDGRKLPSLTKLFNSVSLNVIAVSSYAALAAITDRDTYTGAEVANDAGTHTDLVVGGTVSNSGRFSFVAGKGWQRIGNASGVDAAVRTETAAAAAAADAKSLSDLRYRIPAGCDPAGIRLTGNVAGAVGTTGIFKKTIGTLIPAMSAAGGVVYAVRAAFEKTGTIRVKLYSTTGTGQPVFELDVGSFTPPADTVFPAIVTFVLPSPLKVLPNWRLGVFVPAESLSMATGDASNQVSMSGDYTTPTRNPDNNNSTIARMIALDIRYKSVGDQVDELIVASGSGVSAAKVLRSDTYVRGAEVLPFAPDMTRIAWWGSSTFDYLGAELNTMAGTYGATPYAGGKAGELLEDTLARFGSRPALLNVAGGSIPADRSAIVCTSQNGQTAALKSYSGTLNGVPGVLNWNATNSQLEFVRDTAGSAVAVPNGTAILPTIGRAHRNAVQILNIGKNNFVPDYSSADYIVQNTHEAFDWLSPFLKRVLVVNHYVDMLSAPTDYKRFTKILEVNQKLRDRYGAQCVDMYAFISQGTALFGKTVWQATGITPTADDLAYQARGNKPPSLSGDDQHMNAAGNAGVRWLIQQYIASLGWY